VMIPVYELPTVESLTSKDSSWIKERI
jgi:hypothetical protein